MNKVRNIFALCLLALSQAVGAQDYERVLDRNPWNRTENISGIRQDSLSRSYAEILGQYQGGQFKDSWQAPRTWNAGAGTASIRHLERISFAGSFSFRQSEGYDMCGSMFIEPGRYPVDILEFTPGRKTLQTYTFDGGFSYDLTESWRAGALMDFKSQNMAKRKDLRHTNWKLDMTLSPGMMYHSDGFAVGVNYIFRKNSENVNAEQVGTSESSYYAFLDKGLMYGVHSVWTGSGLHLDESGMNSFPVSELSNGVAVQVQQNGLFAEISYTSSQGTIGEKEYIWFRFPGNRINSMLAYRHIGKGEHYAGINLEWKRQKMDEGILEKVTENGVTTILNHGSNRILSEDSWSLSPEYEYYTDKWEIGVLAHLKWEKGTASQMYPYICERSLMTWSVLADARIDLGQFELEPSVGIYGGRVSEDERMAQEDSGVQTHPFRLEEWYDAQMEYATALRTSAGMTLKYHFRKGIYIKGEALWMHGFGLKHLNGADRVAVSTGIGYNF